MNCNQRIKNIIKKRKKAEKKYDDILWEYGANDPRLADLGSQIQEWRDLEIQNVSRETIEIIE